MARWKRWKRRPTEGSYEIAYNQSTVAARLWFDELVRVVLPMSHWWQTRICKIRMTLATTSSRNCKLRASKAKLLSGWQVQQTVGRRSRRTCCGPFR